MEKNVKRQTGQKKLDIGKVMALYKAGWNKSQIAEEMGVSEEKIYKCIYYQVKKEEVQKEKTKDNNGEVA